MAVFEKMNCVVRGAGQSFISPLSAAFVFILLLGVFPAVFFLDRVFPLIIVSFSAFLLICAWPLLGT